MYPPLREKCLHTWEYISEGEGKGYFLCFDCDKRMAYDQADLDSARKFGIKVRAELYAEIIQLFDSRGMQGARHWREEIQSLVNVIVQSHEDIE